jgi:hypothetical protein
MGFWDIRFRRIIDASLGAPIGPRLVTLAKSEGNDIRQQGEATTPETARLACGNCF